jgi:hypothetical protein
MKKTVLVLVALLSLFPFAQTMAQTAPVAASPAEFLRPSRLDRPRPGTI